MVNKSYNAMLEEIVSSLEYTVVVFFQHLVIRGSKICEKLLFVFYNRERKRINVGTSFVKPGAEDFLES